MGAVQQPPLPDHQLASVGTVVSRAEISEREEV